MYQPAPTRKMRWWFLISFLLMIAHKIESFMFDEWAYSPVYQYFLSFDMDPGRLLFLTFVTTVFAGLAWCFIIIFWRYGPALFLSFWGLTFFFELHHLIRAWRSESYYAGVYTSVIYSIFGWFYWRELVRYFEHLKSAKGTA
jgi:Protein of unknown function with HXXEE motif